MASLDAENQEPDPDEEITITNMTLWMAQKEAFFDGVGFVIWKMAKRICFDHKDLGCDHSACYEISALIKDINETKEALTDG